MPKHPSVSKILISLTAQILLQGILLRSKHPPARCAELSRAVCGWPFLKVLLIFQGFCVICNITVECVLCVLPRSLFRQLLRLVLDSELARSFPVLLVHWWETNCSQLVDARAERCPSADHAQSERSSATDARDRLAVSETLGARAVEAESWRLSRSSCSIFPR